MYRPRRVRGGAVRSRPCELEVRRAAGTGLCWLRCVIPVQQRARRASDTREGVSPVVAGVRWDSGKRRGATGRSLFRESLRSLCPTVPPARSRRRGPAGWPRTRGRTRPRAAIAATRGRPTSAALIGGRAARSAPSRRPTAPPPADLAGSALRAPGSARRAQTRADRLGLADRSPLADRQDEAGHRRGSQALQLARRPGPQCATNLRATSA